MNLYIKASFLLFCFISCNSQVKHKPESISEKLNAGFLAIKNGDTTLAEEKANEAYLMDSTNANALALISEVYKKKKRYQESLEYINKAIKRNNKVALFMLAGR